jgi:hypothetical protein
MEVLSWYGGKVDGRLQDLDTLGKSNRSRLSGKRRAELLVLFH